MDFLPLVLVGVGAVILLVIAVLALVLLRGNGEHPEPGRTMQNPVLTAQGQTGNFLKPVCLSFFRIGASSEAKRMDVMPDLWVSVGSDRKADICLDSENLRLERQHFRLCLTGDTLWVAAGAGEIAVNGVPIGHLGNVPMSSGELLRAGSYEYRVIFSTEGDREKK